MNHEFESTNITTNNEDNTMNTQVVKSAAVKALAAGAMLAATAPFAAVADEGKSTSDYVQDGLVAQWDGVENAGVGLHEDSPSAWVDIVGGLAITIPEWVTVESNGFYSTSSTATRIDRHANLSDHLLDFRSGQRRDDRGRCRARDVAR